MAITPFKRAIGFVDWHTAAIASGARARPRRAQLVAEMTLSHVERILSDYLMRAGTGAGFRVRLRLYAGWHSGRTATSYLRGITEMINSHAARPRPYHGSRIIFDGGHEGIQLGNRLAGVQTRLAPKHAVHFLDTLRYRDGVAEEKMADTALVVDLLGLATRKSADQYIMLSDDDDMLPGLFASEAVGATVSMLSRPNMSSKFMAHARDLVRSYESVPS